MIAERTKVAPSAPMEENLFEGLSLSFPEVPTAPIIAVAPKSATELPAPASVQPKVVESEASKAHVDSTDTQKRKNGNLSALYATEIVTSDSRSLYPDLPSFAAVGRSRSADAEDEEGGAAVDESASLLPRQSSAAVPVVTSSAGSAHKEAPELVTDLMRENTRLADEVANLRRILEDQQQQHRQEAPGTTNSMHNNMLINGTLSNSSGTATVGPPAGTISSVTGVHITDTTKPPEKGVKYVCCGGCRQWLMAPRDAVYVVCSTCEAINNCNLVPKDNTAVHNRENDTRALTQRNGGANNNPFWFLDCLSKGLF